MRHQTGGIKCQQRRAATLPDAVRHAGTLRPLAHQRSRKPRSIHSLRAGQHQVQFQLVVSGLRHLLTQRAVRRQLYEGGELLFQMTRRRIAQQRLRPLSVARKQRRQQVIVLTEASAGIPRRAVLRAVFQLRKRFL